MGTADASTQTDFVRIIEDGGDPREFPLDGMDNDPGNDPEPAVLTLDMAFEAAGIPGVSRVGRFHIYEYPILQAYLAASPSPINWPPAESLILDAASGTVICQARQLRIKGFVAARQMPQY